ncbi:MAG: RNA polymerase sigma factor [Planctomycetaceae bacterium]|nr:RNA polymerase sigma factor [Planctomycetaceae bacterium]
MSDEITEKSVPGMGNIPSAPPEVSLLETFRALEAELFGMLYHFLGNREDAGDAMQDTFIRCWNRRESFSAIENKRAWIFKIAYNISIDLRRSAWHRRKKTFQEGEAALMSTMKEDAVHEAVNREEIALLRHAVTNLDDMEKDVFLLRQNGNLSFEQIAGMLEIPVGTAKTRMRRAVRKLHDLLNDRREKND